MIEVYYVSNTNSGRTAMKWLDNHEIKYSERKITKKKPLKIEEVKMMLFHAENGFDDLINTRTKKFRELKINETEYSTRCLIEQIIKNPSLLKLPIILDEKRLVVGFNEIEISCFLSKEYRRAKLLEFDRNFIDG